MVSESRLRSAAARAVAACSRSAIIVAVPDFVDPQPIVRARLAELAAEHEPRIEVLAASYAGAHPSDARALKKELRDARRVYRAARKDVHRLAGPGVAW